MRPERIALDDRAFAVIVRQSAPGADVPAGPGCASAARSCAGHICSLRPDGRARHPGPIGAAARDMAPPDPGADLLVTPRARRWRSNKPGMIAAARGPESPADPRYRPDVSVLRDEGEPHRESFAK